MTEHPTQTRGTEALVDHLHRLELQAWEHARIADERALKAATTGSERQWKAAARRERSVAAAYANSAFLARSYR